MSDPTLVERSISAGLTLACAALLALRPVRRLARVAWSSVLVLGLGFGLALQLHTPGRANSNLVHHWLGAKYPIPYTRFYRAIAAALEQPPAGVRDLDHPDRLIDSEPAARRAGVIDRLRAHGESFDAYAPEDSLERLDRTSGALAAASARELALVLPARRIEAFRFDARAAATALDTPLTLDYGFNGSPFYALLRQLDPTVHRPFGDGAVWFGVMAQALGALLLVWVVGAVLGLAFEERLAAAALLFASWDFLSYALSGLLFSEFWLPIGLAALALKRNRPALAGVAVAWAGLIKLFPFLLLLPGFVRLMRPRGPDTDPAAALGSARRALVYVLACGLSAALLAMAALASGRSWTDFLHKIRVEFQATFTIVNSVSRDALLLTLGAARSPLAQVLTLAMLVVLAAMFVPGAARRPVAGSGNAALARRVLVMVACTGWLVANWLNYYALMPLLLLPWYARRYRALVALAVAATAASTLLPDFMSPNLVANPALHFAKLLPYLALPAAMLAAELSERGVSRRALRVGAVVAIALAVVVALDAWRQRTASVAARRAHELLESGDAAAALGEARLATRLAPHDAKALLTQGIALATLDRVADAHVCFARAVALAPDDAAAEDDDARLLLREGRSDEAAARLEAGLRASPADPQMLTVLAQIRYDQQRRGEAMALLARAAEIAPDHPELRVLLARLRGAVDSTAGGAP
jgi:tetratricopeptide (TPR) repeat protein